MVASGSVGIGASPSQTFKVQIVDPFRGLRVQANTAGGTIASFGANGDFQIDAANVVGGRFFVRQDGFIGIGHSASDQLLGRVDVLTAGQSDPAVRARNSNGTGMIGISDGGGGAGVLGVGGAVGVQAQVPVVTLNLMDGYVGDVGAVQSVSQSASSADELVA